MALRQILIDDHPMLRAKAAKVEHFDAALVSLVADLWETMHANHGAGLAAPQMGVSRRVLVAKHNGRAVTLVNPCIVKMRGQTPGVEGCLSLPGVHVSVRRAQSVTVSGRDSTGRPLTVEATGQLARILQHEIDHLDGVLITARGQRTRGTAA